MLSEMPLLFGATGSRGCLSRGEVRADGSSAPDAICMMAPVPSPRLAPREAPLFTKAPPGTSTTLTWLSFASESPRLAPFWMLGADTGGSSRPAGSKPVLKPLPAAPAP